MVNYNKLFALLEKKGITSYVIRQKGLIPQSTLQKFRICSGTKEEIIAKLEDYKNKNGKEFKADVSTKTIEDICQLLQCQPYDIMEWKVDLDPELSFDAIKNKTNK